MFASLLNRRFLIFTGKGGVGKTTVATAAAMASARSGARTLLMQFTAHDRVGPLYGAPRPIGSEPVELERDLFAVKPTPDDALGEYAQMILRSRMAYNVVFKNKLVSSFLRAIPSLNELLLLGKAFNHERERDRRGHHAWDRVILDAPATGHSVYLFQVPFVISKAVSSGLMYRETHKMVELLQDPARTALHLVTLPEEMPVNETIQLRDQMRDQLRIPTGTVIANSVFPPLFDPQQQHALRALRQALPETGDVLDRLVAAGTFRVERSELQRSYLQRIRDAFDLPVVELPHLFVPRLGRDELGELAERLRRAATGQPVAVHEPLAPAAATA